MGGKRMVKQLPFATLSQQENSEEPYRERDEIGGIMRAEMYLVRNSIAQAKGLGLLK